MCGTDLVKHYNDVAAHALNHITSKSGWISVLDSKGYVAEFPAARAAAIDCH